MKHGRFDVINILDKTLFRALFEGLQLFKTEVQVPYALDAEGVQRILVIRPGGFGDLLLALPLFRLIQDIFPSATIDLACTRRSVSLVRVLDEELRFARILLLEEDVLPLTREKYDLAMNLDQSKYGYIVPALMGMLNARIKIGYDIRRRSRFCTHRAVYRHDEHETQCGVNMLRFFGVDRRVVAEDLLLKGLQGFRAHAKPLLEKNALEGDRFVACCFGGLNPQNKLPDQTVRAVISLLCEDPELRLVVLGGSADVMDAERLCAGFENRVLNLCGKTTLQETIGLLGYAGVYFGYDGGPLHMAVAAGCKTVSVWGPSLFDKWAPGFSSRHLFVKQRLACQPCLTGRFPVFAGCSFGFECMTGLSAEEIVAKIQKQLVDK